MLKTIKKTAWIFIIRYFQEKRKCTTNYNLISGAIQAHETSPFDYRFKIIKRVLSLS